MDDDGLWQEPLDDHVHTSPRQASLLASPPQVEIPADFDMMAYGAHGVDVGGDREVRIVTFQHARQAAPLCVDRFVPDTLKHLVDRLDRCPLSFALRLSQELEAPYGPSALVFLVSANMREAKKVERLRFPFAASLAPFGHEPAEGDQTRFFGMKFERELGEPLLQIAMLFLFSPEKRRLFVLLRRDGYTASRNKGYRLYRAEGLAVRKRKGRTRGVGNRAV